MMQRTQKWLILLLATAMLIAMLAGCGNGSGTEEDAIETDAAGTDSLTDQDADMTERDTDSTQETRTPFNYSEGLAESGYWSDIQALSHVELFDYKDIDFPEEVAFVSDEELESEINNLLQHYAADERITDRPVSEGDKVHIDFEGSVDGEAFEGGSTQGMGTDVTVGVTPYIEGFLEQLIGKSPGDTFDIDVTFPEDYGVETLNGQDAVFKITIHHIVEVTVPELDDAFVADKLSDVYGWTTADEMRNALRSDLRSIAVESFLSDYLVEQTTVNSIPEVLMSYQEQLMINYYLDYADQYDISFDELLTDLLELETVEDIYEENRVHNTRNASLSLIVQAIAEDAGITVSEADVGQYFKRYMGIDDYSEYTTIYGLPYLQMIVLQHTVFEYLSDINI